MALSLSMVLLKKINTMLFDKNMKKKFSCDYDKQVENKVLDPGMWVTKPLFFRPINFHICQYKTLVTYWISHKYDRDSHDLTYTSITK